MTKMAVTNKDIYKLLRNVACSFELLHENRFRINAYNQAAEAIESSTMEAVDFWREGRLSELPGIGKNISSYLDELFKTGQVSHFKQVMSKFPPSMYVLLDVAGFGPKKAYKIVKELKLSNPATVVDELLQAAKSGKVSEIEGFGVKSQYDIMEALNRFKRGLTKQRRVNLDFALSVAERILVYLQKCKHVLAAVPLGSLRRMMETIGDIDIAAKTNNSEEVINWFIQFPSIEKIIEKGSTGASILLNNNIQVDLRTIKPEQFGSMIQYFTGSKGHNIKLREYALKKGLSLSEYGIKKLKESNKTHEYSSEKEFYSALDLPLIPPEIRENIGEVEAALHNNLPHLVKLTDIKGDMHIHSNYDIEPSHDLGISGIPEILKQAKKLGYEYLGISDHNPSIGNHTNIEIISILKRRRHFIEHFNSSQKSVRVHLFVMLEIDILADGTLALPEGGFEYIDAAVVSVHSSFQMDIGKMTQRIIKGLSHKKARIFGHPTGRLLGKREGYQVRWNELFRFMSENNKSIEINSSPFRLDLPDLLVREAIKHKIPLIIDTDSHEVSGLNDMKYGVSVARRGWAQKHDILNCLSYNRISTWLKDK